MADFQWLVPSCVFCFFRNQNEVNISSVYLILIIHYASSSSAIAVSHPSVYGPPCGYFVDEVSWFYGRGESCEIIMGWLFIRYVSSMRPRPLWMRASCTVVEESVWREVGNSGGIFLLRISLVFLRIWRWRAKTARILAVLFDDFALAGMYKLLWGREIERPTATTIERQERRRRR